MSSYAEAVQAAVDRLERRQANTPLVGQQATVKFPIRTDPRPDGLVALVHEETGEVLGVAATPAVAAATRTFFAP